MANAKQAELNAVRPYKGVWYSRVRSGFWFQSSWLWQKQMPEPLEVFREIMTDLQ
jgi:hypothetical protein